MCQKDDFPGFDLEESVNSPSNRELMERVKQEVFHHVGGQDHCQWSNAQIEEAFKRYFLSTYELEGKIKSGRYEEHKQKSRRQDRIREKLTRRTLALEMPCCNWDRRRKAEVAEILNEDFMSSEESADDENGHTVYQVKKLSWESARLKKTKHKLDKWYTKGIKGSKRRTVKRVQVDEMSQHEVPETCPEWACNQATED